MSGLMALGKDDNLIVADYNYQLEGNKRDDLDFDTFAIAPESIKFHLFESV